MKNLVKGFAVAVAFVAATVALTAAPNACYVVYHYDSASSAYETVVVGANAASQHIANHAGDYTDWVAVPCNNK